VPELSVDNAAASLSRHGLAFENLRFAELGGGISNKVILAENTGSGGGFRAVLKQSLGQLRTETGWHSERERIFREAAAMRWMAEKAESGAFGTFRGSRVPRILFEDPGNFTIAMEAAPPGAEMWKTLLFRGEHDRNVARLAGATLGSMISASLHDPEAERLFGDQTVFDQLRIDPYYRFTASRLTAGRRPEAAEYIHRLISRSGMRRSSLVHGDWSPKNLLVHHVAQPGSLWVIDWEVVHYGDPSFDVAFLLNHLLLKSIAMPRYGAQLAGLADAFIDGFDGLGGLSARLPADCDWIVPAALEHLPALLLARVEGKSPAEYLDSEMRDRAAVLALDLMNHPAASVGEVFLR
jgi:Phosphotransferase enzyme family